MKRRKKRSVFSEETVVALNQEFTRDQNPNNAAVAQISAKVGYSRHYRLAEIPEFWNLEFQQDLIFAYNLLFICRVQVTFLYQQITRVSVILLEF